jgi:hypothetical protein
MAITLKTNKVGNFGFIANGNSADLSGCETLAAAVTGKSIVIERLTITSGAAINVSVGEGETGGAITTTLLGPFYMAANSRIDMPFPRGVKLTAATALTADASGAGNVTIIAQGRIE